MSIDRRTMLQGLGAAAMASAVPAVPVWAAQSGTRVFDLYRGKKKIGAQEMRISRSGRSVDVAIDIDIKVRILGLPAYSYSLASKERWTDGILQGLEARTNDDGTKDRVSASRAGGGLQVDGTGFSGVVSGNPGTTTYWTQAFLTRPVWISTQTGQPLNVRVSKGAVEQVPTGTGAVSATRWKIRGDIGALDLFYDKRGEWVGNEFEAKGQTARFMLRNRGAGLAALWVNA